MLAPRSARAKHSSNSGKSHGIRNLPGSPNFSGNLSEHRCKLRHVQESIREAQLEVEIPKISINFKAKRSSFSWIFSLFTLDGYGKVVLVLGMTTGSSTWIIGGWTSLVLPLGSTVSFVTSVSTSTTGGGI
ncbi:hypothetical protein Tco_1297269 [Tanacetum coccineum]